VSTTSKVDVSSINHGFFQFTFPTGWKKITAWVVAFFIYLAAFIFFVVSLGIPDVPPVSEISVISSFDELENIEEENLGNGWDNYTKGKFFIIESKIVEGELLYGY